MTRRKNRFVGDFTATVADLATGDRLMHLGGVGFGQLFDSDADPVLVADVHPAPEDTTLAQVITSAGTLYAYRDTEARAVRSNEVTARTVLLISRRHMLCAALTALGTPVVRRTPVDPGPDHASRDRAGVHERPVGRYRRVPVQDDSSVHVDAR